MFVPFRHIDVYARQSRWFRRYDAVSWNNLWWLGSHDTIVHGVPNRNDRLTFYGMWQAPCGNILSQFVYAVVQNLTVR